jgi:FkbM family methyltransferase
MQKYKIKTFLNQTITLAVDTLRRASVGKYLVDQGVSSTIESIRKINYKGVNYSFGTPNRLCEYRVDSFATKEPETLEWIDSIPLDSVVWDIGANIGLYSVYAAKTRNSSVFAFEPSVFNLELLARNIFLNDLTNKVVIVPLPLNDHVGYSNMRMTSTEWGGALSSFDHDLGFDGEKVRKVFEFRVVGVSMEGAKRLLGIPQPDYIKMDVDGIEHFILKGGADVLKKVKGLLIEVNDDFEEQASQCKELLQEAGLTLKEKRHGDIFEENASLFKNCYNQIWAR